MPEERGNITGSEIGSTDSITTETKTRRPRRKKIQPDEPTLEQNLVTEIEIPETVEKVEKTPRKKKKTKQDTTEIKMLLQGLSSIVAFRFGVHWNITDEESESIATPLANMIEKHNLTEKLSEVSDGVMLVIATSSIVIPRVLITKSLMEKKPKEVLLKEGELKNENTNNSTNDSINAGKTSKSQSADGDFIKKYTNAVID